MRFLHLIRSTDPVGGGPIEVVWQFARAHLAQGHQVEVVSLDRPDEAFGESDKVPVHRLGDSQRSYGFSPRLIPWLNDHADDYDAMIVHGLWQYHGRATRLASLKSSKPYYVFPHGMLDRWFRTAYPLKHFKKSIYWRLIEHKVLRDSAAVLFTCEEERRLAQKTFSPYRCEERIVPLGISLPPPDVETQRARFYHEFPQLQGKHLLLFLGRLHNKKGCDLLIQAFAACLRGGSPLSESSLYLMMAGPCESQDYLQKLHALVDPELGEINGQKLASRVLFPGMLSGDLKWGAYRAAEAFVLPSHQENFGIAVVEALACGRPVLISNKVNIWREIEADGAGFVDEDTVEGCTKLIRKWLQISEEAKVEMTDRAKRCFEKRFRIDASAKHLTEALTPANEVGSH